MKQLHCDRTLALEPESHTLFHWPNSRCPTQAQFSFGKHLKWSGSIPLEFPDNITLKLKTDASNTEHYFMRVQISVEGAVTTITLQPEMLKLIPYKIVNKFQFEVRVNQLVPYTL